MIYLGPPLAITTCITGEKDATTRGPTLAKNKTHYFKRLLAISKIKAETLVE